jgi:hypothetical protein
MYTFEENMHEFEAYQICHIDVKRMKNILCNDD